MDGVSDVKFGVVELLVQEYAQVPAPAEGAPAPDPAHECDGIGEPSGVPGWCQNFNLCSGSFIAEHWILTAAHCAPEYEKVTASGHTAIVAYGAKGKDKPRHFKAYVRQKISARRVDKCLGPVDNPSDRQNDCWQDIVAYPYQEFPTGHPNSMEMTKAASTDASLWFLTSVFPKTVNFTSRPLEPEDFALPISTAHDQIKEGLTPPQTFTPWGWGPAVAKAPSGGNSIDAFDLRQPPDGKSIVLRASAQRLLTDETVTNYASDKDDQAKICEGDSGGPLLRKSSDGTYAIMAVASNVLLGANENCASLDAAMTWSRVDSDSKRKWIRDTISKYPVDPSFQCRSTADYMQCWHKSCVAGGSGPDDGCPAGERCTPYSQKPSLTGKREKTAPTRKARCMAKGS